MRIFQCIRLVLYNLKYPFKIEQIGIEMPFEGQMEDKQRTKNNDKLNHIQLEEYKRTH